MKALKTILTILLLAAALLAACTALFWQVLLTPQQKLHYGLYVSANADYRARAAAHPDNPDALNDYAGTLVATGNFGRAGYLCKLYGAQHPVMAEWEGMLARGVQAAEGGQVYDYLADPAAAQLDGLPPAKQALRFLQGYQFALSGDWASAKNHFQAVERKRLAPQLRLYLDYYLARSYRLAGSVEERKEIEPLLKPLLEQDSDLALSDKARYNLIAWFLSDAYAEGANNGSERARVAVGGFAKAPLVIWPAQKAATELGQYLLDQGELASAWKSASQAIELGIDDPAAKAAGELCLSVLAAALKSSDTKILDEQGALKLEFGPGQLIILARCAARHDFSGNVVKLYPQLKDHITDRVSWEELRVGLAVCYGAKQDSKAFKALMADANLRSLCDESLGEIYFEYAALLERLEQWNDALSYFKSASKLGGPRAGDALYHCYAILKHVTEPLNLETSTEYLRQVAEQHPQSAELPKAAEELLPILIYRGQSQAAEKLCDWILSAAAEEKIAASVRGASFERLKAVAHFWKAYLADKRGEKQAASKERRAIPCKYFSYYELSSNFPPVPGLPEDPAVLRQPESAGEYLIGLGLTDPAREYFAAQDDAANSVLLCGELTLRAATAPLHTRQYAATELLESGVIGEAALLKLALSEAYPRPFDEYVNASAQRQGVPPELAYAVIKKESNFREDSVSWVGAEGLMQLMPATVRWLISARSVGVDYSQRQQPKANIELGCAYLAHLLEQTGSIRAVLHSYNGGPGNYEKWAAQYPGASGALFTDLVPNEENEAFAKKVYKYMKIYEWLEQPAAAQE